VIPSHEGKGIGRALLAHVLQELPPERFPVYLHTQPGSFRAIKLYSDFGFSLLSDPVIGFRKNDLEASLGYLEQAMSPADFTKLQIAKAPKEFLDAVCSSAVNEF
jgi:ribosomal protein S18 acetylase RimI-like enzyme